MADNEAVSCANCGTSVGPTDATCPGCGVSRKEALSRGSRSEDEVTEASKDSFPASDPPAY